MTSPKGHGPGRPIGWGFKLCAAIWVAGPAGLPAAARTGAPLRALVDYASFRGGQWTIKRPTVIDQVETPAAYAAGLEQENREAA